jgi:hypothetical protein
MSIQSEGHTSLDQIRVRRMITAAERPAIIANGIEALKRLVTLARKDNGQCQIAARFVLGLYNGSRFPFDLTGMRCVEESVFVDCMSVLRMDARAMEMEVHDYFENGGELFESIVDIWGFEEN